MKTEHEKIEDELNKGCLKVIAWIMLAVVGLLLLILINPEP